jgi:hypothetical protein
MVKLERGLVHPRAVSVGKIEENREVITSVDAERDIRVRGVDVSDPKVPVMANFVPGTISPQGGLASERP